MPSTKYGKLAQEYFLQGYNCCQSVVLAFSEFLPVEKQQLASLSSSFGGGMGRLREVCGAVSGIFMVAGLLYGYSEPETGAAKSELYACIQSLANDFRTANGSYICRELLGLDHKFDIPNASPRTAEFYASRPCGRLIGYAADELALYIHEHPPVNTKCNIQL